MRGWMIQANFRGKESALQNNGEDYQTKISRGANRLGKFSRVESGSENGREDPKRRYPKTS